MEEEKKESKKQGSDVAGAKEEARFASIRETIISADLPSDDSRPEIPKPKKKD